MNNWINYKNEILNFDEFNKLGTQSYKERLGSPDELSSCIGLISIGFQQLEDKISEGIKKLLNVNNERGKIITSELSFKGKLNLFFSLIIESKENYYFNRLIGEGFKENYLNEFRIALFKCEELRNKVMHSSFIINKKDSKTVRVKTTSKAKKGLVIRNEKINIYELLNIYDFIISMTIEIDDFFIGYKRI